MLPVYEQRKGAAAGGAYEVGPLGLYFNSKK